jgi:hypothetical protein
MHTYANIQRYVIKICTSRLRRAGWSLDLTIDQAWKNKELVALGDSQLMRFLDELDGGPDSAARSREIAAIQTRLKKLKRRSDTYRSKPLIKDSHAELDRLQFQRDYVCVVIDTNKDYQKIYADGFRINGILYRRLLGTTGGVKKSTIVFVNAALLPEVKRRIDNGRNPHMPFTPAKLEAYRSLVCSSSMPVSWPEGILVIKDCVTHFQSDVIELDDDGREQPRMKSMKDKEIELVDSDGYGLATPQLMRRWGKEVGKNYLLPGCVIRNAFCKGCLFPVDFQEFARKHHVTSVTDAWGTTRPLTEVELVLTTSMLKLWDSYDSMEDYLKNCRENHYTFAITKASEERPENIHTTNYQFLQSYDFTDEQIDELIAPTVTEIKDILHDDYRKAILYAKGTNLAESNVPHMDASPVTALMVEPGMMNDPCVKKYLQNMIKYRIDDAKIGILNIPGNYSLASGDPYSLCQSMCGLPVTGLLKAGQIYSKHWVDKGVDKIACFRAPMTSHNNIRLLDVVHTNEMDDFYRYMTTPTIFNSWDTCADAMNGLDKDGDTVFTTSLPLIIEQTKELPAIVCVQRKAPKCVPTEDDLMRSNIQSFGDAIGKITNNITSMFEVRARYEKDSMEYQILDYRIKCGQLYQQNQIDKAKGIEAGGMPIAWYKKGDSSKTQKNQLLDQMLVADKKPYFMQCIYPSERRKYQDYLKNAKNKCQMVFRCTLEELQEKSEKTPKEKAFLYYYEKNLPLGTAPCTINKICWKIEDIFKDMKFPESGAFDYSVLKSDATYSKSMYYDIQKIYKQYQQETANYSLYAKAERIKTEEQQEQTYLFKEHFKQQCLERCPNENVLCNIVLDLCYTKSGASKWFAWDVCGDVFIRNLLEKNGHTISYPVPDEHGEVEYGGARYRMVHMKLNDKDSFFR